MTNMRPELQESLKQQEVCPKCGAHWRAIGQMLRGPAGSDNLYLAEVIIDKCDVCQARFKVRG